MLEQKRTQLQSLTTWLHADCKADYWHKNSLERKIVSLFGCRQDFLSIAVAKNSIAYNFFRKKNFNVRVFVCDSRAFYHTN